VWVLWTFLTDPAVGPWTRIKRAERSALPPPLPTDAVGAATPAGTGVAAAGAATRASARKAAAVAARR